MNLKALAFTTLMALAIMQSARALSPGDVTFVGYSSNGDDSFSFVTWVELSPNETLLFIDAEYDGEGDGSGEGINGGYYANSRTIQWTNTTGSSLGPGTVVIISNLSNSSSSTNIGSSSGGFGLTNQGEQIFIAQGVIATDEGNGYLDGELIFGLDYEGGPTWGENGESKLPNVLDIVEGNISFGSIDDHEYSGTRTTLALSAYLPEILNLSRWSAPVGGILSPDSFQENSQPPVVIPDELGAVSGGLLFHPKRLNGSLPIIDETWMLSQGATAREARNINGPSCIRLPDWLPAADRAHPTAVYYLYFAHHSGNFIRMAWAANLEGPWTGWNMAPDLPLQQRGVLSLGDDGILELGNDLELSGHIASPQVFVDDDKQEFLMYYHGPSSHNGNNRGQSTAVATSSDGLNFNQPNEGGQTGHGSIPVLLGESYFRVFKQAGRFYAFSNTGDLWAAPSGQDPLSPPAGYDYSRSYWDRGPNLFANLRQARGWSSLRPRHFAVYQRDNLLYAFLTYKEGRPERISVATFDFNDLPAEHENWSFHFPEQELLQAEVNWEGSQFPPLASQSGSRDDGVNQLRDPGIFQDSDGRLYMFYSGQGEDALGLAQLVTHPQVTGDTEVTTGQDLTFTVASDIDVTPTTRRISKSEPIAIHFDAEAELSPLNYAGSNGYSVLQDHASSGNQSYQLAHLNSNDDETLTFPFRYYARPGASIQFDSRLAASTNGQVAELQVSFDGNLWQSIWIRVGGNQQSTFSLINLDIDGLVGRAFHIRLRYHHDPLRNSAFVAGSASDEGWLIDNLTAEGLEKVTIKDEQPFASHHFNLQSLSTILTPNLTIGGELEDRFLIEIDGMHANDTTGFGKPFILRVRSSYEDFLDTYLTETQQDNSSLADPAADPDRDGLSNLLEHVSGTNPLEGNRNQTSFSNLSTTTLDPALTFRWNPNTGYRYQLQMSTALDDFTDIPSSEFAEAAIPGGNLVNLTIKPDLAPSALPDTAAFFRLKVTAE